MTRSKDYYFMLTLSIVVAAISVIGLGYIYQTQPEYLRSDRDGVPYFTAKVTHPETGDAIEMGELIRHFKGE